MLESKRAGDCMQSDRVVEEWKVKDLEALLKETAETLLKANKMIYAQDTLLGSDDYFKLRTLLTDQAKKVEKKMEVELEY